VRDFYLFILQLKIGEKKNQTHRNPNSNCDEQMGLSQEPRLRHLRDYRGRNEE